MGCAGMGSCWSQQECGREQAKSFQAARLKAEASKVLCRRELLSRLQSHALAWWGTGLAAGHAPRLGRAVAGPSGKVVRYPGVTQRNVEWLTGDDAFQAEPRQMTRAADASPSDLERPEHPRARKAGGGFGRSAGLPPAIGAGSGYTPLWPSPENQPSPDFPYLLDCPNLHALSSKSAPTSPH